MVFPTNNLAPQTQKWGRDVEHRIEKLETDLASSNINNITRDVQLQNAYNRLDVAVTDITTTQGLLTNTDGSLTNLITQVSEASDAKSTALLFTGTDGAKTDVAVARITFVKPTWAASCSVTVQGTVTGYTSNQTTYPIVGSFKLGFNSTAVQYNTSISDPTPNGTAISRSFSTYTVNQPTVGSIGYSYDGAMSSNVVVEILVTKNASASVATYVANIAGNIYWY